MIRNFLLRLIRPEFFFVADPRKEKKEEDEEEEEEEEEKKKEESATVFLYFGDLVTAILLPLVSLPVFFNEKKPKKTKRTLKKKDFIERRAYAWHSIDKVNNHHIHTHTH